MCSCFIHNKISLLHGFVYNMLNYFVFVCFSVSANKIQPCFVKLETLPKYENEDKVKCIYCSVYLKNIHKLNIHVLRRHEDKRMECPPSLNCLSCFETAEERDEHISQVHNEKKKGFYCIICIQFL